MKFYKNLLVQNLEVNCFIKTSPRAKHLKASLNENRQLVIITPEKFNDNQAIENLLTKCKSWLLKKGPLIFINRDPKPFVANEEIPIFGVPHKICFEPKQSPHESGVTINNQTITVHAAPGMHVFYLKQFLNQYALNQLSQWTALFARQINKQVKSVKITSYKSKWGCCKSDGSITYSYFLVFAPESVAKYVCAHEVAHLRYMHHQSAFWNLVEKLYPNYKQDYAWLKKHGTSLHMWGKEAA